MSVQLRERDPEYYKDEGDLVVAVEDRLFRIDRAHLRKEPSVFADMLLLEQPGGDIDGSSDAKPLVLSGDTVGEFRALCWMMYASPSDTTAVVQGKSKPAEVHQLLSLALIAHKYQFTEIERWARTYLELHCSTPATQPYIHFPTLCTNEALTHLVRYATIVESRSLQEAALDSIRARVSGEQKPMGLIEALNIADTFGLRSLQGEMCYRILCDACRSMANTMGPTEVMTFSKFRSHLPSDTSELQKDRLIQGYFTLIAVKDKVFESLHGNVNMTGRSDIALADLGHDRKVSVDILGRIDQLLVLRPLDTMRTQLVALYFEVKEAIPGYFLGKEGKM